MGNRWNQETVTIPSNAVYIAFRAYKGGVSDFDVRGDIALDEITIDGPDTGKWVSINHDPTIPTNLLRVHDSQIMVVIHIGSPEFASCTICFGVDLYQWY